MPYKKIFVIIALVCVTLTYVSCSNTNTSKAPAFIPIDQSLVLNVKIFNDATGDKYIIEDTSQINEIIGKINALKFKNGHKFDSRKNGYMYSITWYDKQDIKIGSITILHPLSFHTDDYEYAFDCKELIDCINSITNWEPLSVP